MKYHLLLLAAVMAVCFAPYARAADPDPYNIRIIQRGADGQPVVIDIDGAANVGKVLGFVGLGTIDAITPAAPITDGDKGGITVSSGGTVWTIDPLTITNAMIAAGAAIDLSKLAVNPLARANHTGTQDAATITGLAPSATTDTTNAANITSGTLPVARIGTGDIGPTQLASTAVAAGSYTTANITVDADGRITSATNGSGSGGFTTGSFTGTGTYAASNPGTIYSGTMSAAATVTLNLTAGQAVEFSLNVTGATSGDRTFSWDDAAQRIGFAGGPITSLVIEDAGYHSLLFYHDGTGLRVKDSDAPQMNLASDVVGTLPPANGGTGITSLGAGIQTFLGTPTAANLMAATTIPVTIGIAASDETTAITTGTGKATFILPHAMTLTAVRASVTTAPTGSTIIIDINEDPDAEGGTGSASVLSTKLTIDASERRSTTAATAAVISDTALADGAEITIDFDQVGSTVAGAGVKIWLIGTR